MDKLKNMTVEELETRSKAIIEELETDGADLEALKNEARAIREEVEARRAEESKKAEIRAAVAAGEGETVKKVEEVKTMVKTNEEIRASKEYTDAFARYLQTENDAEVRSLLTENVSGSVPVPAFVDEIVRTAWDKSEILQGVKKTNIRGNLKVPFELSATDAAVHTEGQDGPAEETLALGIVTMIPANVKKWIRVSDEVVAMGGEALVRYVYDELTYKIVKKLEDLLVSDVTNAGTADATHAGAALITEAPSVTAVANAFSQLSDEAVNPVVVMNRATYAAFIAAQAAANYAFDPFMGFPVMFNNSLPAYDTASADDVYAFVGDLQGLQVNYPEGEGVVIKYDDLSEAQDDLVKIVGRQYAAHALTASGRFCNIAKPE